MPGKEEKVAKVRMKDGRYEVVKKDLVGYFVAKGLIAEILSW